MGINKIRFKEPFLGFKTTSEGSNILKLYSVDVCFYQTYSKCVTLEESIRKSDRFCLFFLPRITNYYRIQFQFVRPYLQIVAKPFKSLKILKVFFKTNLVIAHRLSLGLKGFESLPQT